MERVVNRSRPPREATEEFENRRNMPAALLVEFKYGVDDDYETGANMKMATASVAHGINIVPEGVRAFSNCRTERRGIFYVDSAKRIRTHRESSATNHISRVFLRTRHHSGREIFRGENLSIASSRVHDHPGGTLASVSTICPNF